MSCHQIQLTLSYQIEELVEVNCFYAYSLDDNKDILFKAKIKKDLRNDLVTLIVER